MAQDQLVIKHAGGRPLKFRSATQLQPYIDEYFNQTPKDEWTITGLALYLGMSRRQLLEYGGRGEFNNCIKMARQQIENAWEQRLMTKSTAGAIFALKQFGWTDTRTVEQHTTVDITHTVDDTLGADYLSYRQRKIIEQG